MFVAPVLVGGARRRTAVEGIGVARRSPPGRARVAIEVERIEDDVLIIARLQEW